MTKRKFFVYGAMVFVILLTLLKSLQFSSFEAEIGPAVAHLHGADDLFRFIEEAATPMKKGSEFLRLFPNFHVETPSDASAYCERTNPPPQLAPQYCMSTWWQVPGSMPPWRVITLVVTVAEEALLQGGEEEFKWLDEIPAKKVLYVKSNATVSFRSNGLVWENGTAERIDAEGFWSADGSSPKFRSVARSWHFKTPVEIVEHPNVGDEALSIVHYMQSRKVDTNMTVFVHGHVSSWHSADIVEQLSCMCFDATGRYERYRTLTSPENAFLLQCMAFVPPAEDVIDEAPKHLRAWLRIQATRASEGAEMFRDAFKVLFPRFPPPVAIVRDCCSTFMIHRTAFSEQRLQSTLDSLFDLLRWQPHHQRDASHPWAQIGRSSEVSMYLERFWRFLFCPTHYDFLRDFSAVRCKYRGVFDCPPSVVYNSSSTSAVSVDNFEEYWKARSCPSMFRNRFG